jgi:phosphate uptake regulator
VQEPSQQVSIEKSIKIQITCKSTYIQSDDEVVRFSLYISRNLVLALHNGQHQINQIRLKTASDCPSYRIDLKSIERIGDHESGIAEKCLELKRKLVVELVSTVSKISELSLSVFRDSLESFLQRNYELDEKKVDISHYVYPMEENVITCLQKSKEVHCHSGSIRLVLENIGGTEEYASDIAETAIDETISEIMESRKGVGDQTHE